MKCRQSSCHNNFTLTVTSGPIWPLGKMKFQKPDCVFALYPQSDPRIWFGYDVRCRWSSSDKKFFLRLDGRTGVKPIYFWQCGYIKRSTRLLSPPKVCYQSILIVWMSTECSRNVQGNPDCQALFNGHSVPMNATEMQAQFCDHSGVFFNFQKEHNSKMFHQIRCIKFILLWITAHEKKSLKKHSNIYMYILF